MTPSERTCFLIALVAFHVWAWLVYRSDTTINQCVAAFALAFVWCAVGVVKLCIRMDS